MYVAFRGVNGVRRGSGLELQVPGLARIDRFRGIGAGERQVAADRDPKIGPMGRQIRCFGEATRQAVHLADEPAAVRIALEEDREWSHRGWHS